MGRCPNPDWDGGGNAKELPVNMPADGAAIDHGAVADPIAVVLAELQSRLDALPVEDLHAHAAFLSTYGRTTEAVEDAVRSGVFEDPVWVSAYVGRGVRPALPGGAGRVDLRAGEGAASVAAGVPGARRAAAATARAAGD